MVKIPKLAKPVEGRKAFLLALLGEPCPKERLSQNRIPIEPLTQQHRGKGLFSLPQLS
jgi:hypothetical protein